MKKNSFTPTVVFRAFDVGFGTYNRGYNDKIPRFY